jgi:hypothetical protein
MRRVEQHGRKYPMMDDRSHTTKRISRSGRASARYERDLYGWAVEQAALLRAGRLDEVDARNIAEELDDAGSEQYDKLASALRIILVHLLKWDHQAQRRTRSWRASILVQRNHVRRVLKKNPGLKARVEEAVSEAYADARIEAAAQTQLDERGLPARCPYPWQQIMDRAVEWPPTP